MPGCMAQCCVQLLLCQAGRGRIGLGGDHLIGLLRPFAEGGHTDDAIQEVWILHIAAIKAERQPAQVALP